MRRFYLSVVDKPLVDTKKRTCPNGQGLTEVLGAVAAEVRERREAICTNISKRTMLNVKAEDLISSVTTNGFQRILHLQSND